MKTVKKKPIEEKAYLQNLLSQFVKLQAATKNKIEKYQDLMSRRSASKWSAEKKKKMQARIEQARIEYAQTFEIIDQITVKLTQLNSSP